MLHFIYNNAYDGDCATEIKGYIPAKVAFSISDTATKMFTSELLGK